MDRTSPKIKNQKSPAPSTSTTSTSKSKNQPAVSPIKTLSSFIDVDKLRIHTDQKEIELIWRAGHTKDNLICAVIPSPIYNRMTSLARHNPMFIIPLPRENGIEMHFGQFKFAETNVTHILFTSLLEYKMHGEFARPHSTVMHFEDLADDKGIVLMRGEIDANQRVVGVDDALLLVMGVQKLYGTEPESERGRIRRKLVEQVTKGAEEFDIKILMDELNRIE
jgi:ATP synthase F1 complex assembly factor 1